MTTYAFDRPVFHVANATVKVFRRNPDGTERTEEVPANTRYRLCTYYQGSATVESGPYASREEVEAAIAEIYEGASIDWTDESFGAETDHDGAWPVNGVTARCEKRTVML